MTKKLSKVLPNSVAAQAAHTASELHSPKKYVTQAMSDVLCKEVPEALKKNGIHSSMEEVFREHTFAVLEVRLVYVDPLVLVSAWTEGGIPCFQGFLDCIGHIQGFLDCIGASNRKYFEEEYRKFIAFLLLQCPSDILRFNEAQLMLFLKCGSTKDSRQTTCYDNA